MKKEERVELHLHTNMSGMDGVNTASEYIKEAKERGMTAIAITDHGVVQAFPEAYKAAKNNDMKIIYGMEGYFVNDKEQIVFGKSDENFNDTFVVVDIETTGLDCNKDKITEIAACKVCNKEIVDTYSSFVNPGIDISEEITKLTGITNEMVADSPAIGSVLKQFIEFCGNAMIIAHNAKFDIGFIAKAAKENDIEFNPRYLDTLALSRFLLPEFRCHRLSFLCREMEIDNDCEHRAVSDATATAKLFVKFTEMLEKKEITNVSVIDDKNDVPYYKGKRYHITILAENKTGLKNLYKLVSKSHTEHFWKRPIILRSELIKYGDGLLYGTACSEGEIYSAILEGKTDDELDKMALFYNFFEVQPIENSRYLVEIGHVANDDELREINKRIVKLAKDHAMIVVADGDVHFLNTDDGECRKILMHSQGYESFDHQPDMRLKTTEEMLEEFSYLGEEVANEIVIRTPNIIADLIDDNMEPIPQNNYYPKMDDSDERIVMWSYIGARKKYGKHIPAFIEERLKWELDKIKENGYADLYMIADEMMKPAHRKGYAVGSRGLIASSLVAHFLGITEINPVEAHYYCEKCGHYEQKNDVNCGCDLPDKICPECGQELLKDGFNIPIETFMGSDGEKEPDMDFNFAAEIRDDVEERIRKRFGTENVVCAGTISTIGEEVAERYVLNYCKEKNIAYSNERISEYVWKLRNIKRTTGLHPGGVMIVPENMDVFDFTPLHCPANCIDSGKVTTHFDYYNLFDCLYKFDILTHDMPSMLYKLEKLTGIKQTTIPLNDSETMRLLADRKTLGVPEFSPLFVRHIISKTGIESFDDLIRISGLSHGTDTWIHNAEYNIEDGVKLSDIISTRDDITIYLEKCGYSRKEAFKISERVRKGKGLTEEQEEDMYQKGIPEWYIESCNTVRYLFPRAHALSYVLLAYRIAYYKAHYPVEFYCAYFNMNMSKFNAEFIVGKNKKLSEKIAELKVAEEESTDEKLKEMLEVCQEMYDRGYEFMNDEVIYNRINSFFVEDGMIKPSVH